MRITHASEIRCFNFKVCQRDNCNGGDCPNVALWSPKLFRLISRLPPELIEEYSTGRDLIDSIVDEAYRLGRRGNGRVKCQSKKNK